MRSVDLQVHLEDGKYIASGHEMVNGVRFSILAEGDNWDALKADVQAVLRAVYYDTPKPDTVHLHLLHDERLLDA